MRLFSGSYRPDQTIFLLDPVDLPSTPVEEKERLIQSGCRHYSEMITREEAPDPEYLAVFKELTGRYKVRLASEVKALARAIAADCPGAITLVSLARAGTPIGALLKYALELEGRPTAHYSISIVLDRGIDEAALSYLVGCEGREPGSIRFVDGWTAKGSIGRELRDAVGRWNRQHGGSAIDPSLHVVMDLAGTAAVSATLEDYAIPCGVLNATVSGLISRTILLPNRNPDAWHGCIYYGELAAHDLTQWFYDQILHELPDGPVGQPVRSSAVEDRRKAAADFLAATLTKYGLSRVNRIKPGVAEATRALLRRLPERLVVRDPECVDISHLLLLARKRNIEVEVDSTIPYNAWALISRSHD